MRTRRVMREPDGTSGRAGAMTGWFNQVTYAMVMARPREISAKGSVQDAARKIGGKKFSSWAGRVGRVGKIFTKSYQFYAKFLACLEFHYF